MAVLSNRPLRIEGMDGCSQRMADFSERLRDVVLAHPVMQRLVATGINCCNSGMGPFDNTRAALCYCRCYAPLHYVSFTKALNRRFPQGGAELPSTPLIVDLGCGPSTSVFAVGDWLYGLRGDPIRVGYIGVDHSVEMLDLGRAMLRDAGAFDPNSRFALRRSVDRVSADDIRHVRWECDGVLFVMSYVLHQVFMRSMEIQAGLMRRVREFTAGEPSWLFVQDANYPDNYGGPLTVWPENRINRLADLCEGSGYTISSRNGIFRSPRVGLAEDGSFIEGPANEGAKVWYSMQQIAGRG